MGTSKIENDNIAPVTTYIFRSEKDTIMLKLLFYKKKNLWPLGGQTLKVISLTLQFQY